MYCRDVNKARDVKAKAKAKAENAKVNFSSNAKVNPVFQMMRVINNCNKISKQVSQAFYDNYLATQMLEFNAHSQ